MHDKLVTGTIEDKETGEIIEIEHYSLFTDYKLTTIVQIIKAECFEPNKDGLLQIDFDCKALDTNAMVYDLSMTFIMNSPEEQAMLLLDLPIDSIHVVSGNYGINNKKMVYLYSPEYRSVEPDYHEDDVRKAFRINEKHKRCN